MYAFETKHLGVDDLGDLHLLREGDRDPVNLGRLFREPVWPARLGREPEWYEGERDSIFDIWRGSTRVTDDYREQVIDDYRRAKGGLK